MITQSQAARLVGVSRQAINLIAKEDPLPEFFVKNEKGKLDIDETHPAWIARAQKIKTRSTVKTPLDNIGAKVTQAIKKAEQKAKGGEILTLVPPVKSNDRQMAVRGPDSKDAPDMSSKIDKMYEGAQVAEFQKRINQGIIIAEKAKQEQIKTLEKKRELGPIDIIKHFFSFAESMIQKIFRRPHEIMPDLAALILAGEQKKAEQKIIREMEGIVKETVKELRDELKKEGFRIRTEKKKGKGEK
jgi:hypothetical protein